MVVGLMTLADDRFIIEENNSAEKLVSGDYLSRLGNFPTASDDIRRLCRRRTLVAFRVVVGVARRPIYWSAQTGSFVSAVTGF